MAMNPNQMPVVPSLAQLQTYAVNVAGQVEGVGASLYDFQTYANAGTTTQYTFFQVPVGQSSKTKADTNMEAAGSLPSPKNFLVQSIEVFFFPGVNPSVYGAGAVSAGINDTYIISKAGYLEFFIGSKTYLTEAPIGRFPPKNGLAGFAAASDTTTAGASQQYRTAYSTMAGKPYELFPWILLQPTQNFNVTLNFPSTTAISADARIGVVLHGILYRNSQ